MKNKKLITTILSAITLAMVVALIVLNILRAISFNESMILLVIGLICFISKKIIKEVFKNE